MTTLDDLCELIVDCEHKTAPTQEEGYPSIRTPNIGRGRFILDGVNRVSEETYRQWTRRAIPQPGDLIMAREAPVGNVAMIPEGLRACLGQRTLLIRPDPSKIEPAYLSYFLNGPHGQGLIHGKTNGATVAHLNMKDVRSLPIPQLPPLPVQRRIAGILAAYDELIENSQRRIRLLEDMARALYREWFVHFRFPRDPSEALAKEGSDPLVALAKEDGHESVPCLPSALGDIPQGWEVCALGDFVQFKSGFAFKSGTFVADGEHRLVTIKNVQDGAFNPESDSRMDELPAKLPPYCVLNDGDILLSLTGNVGRVCLVFDGPFLLNQRVSKLAPAEASDWAMTYCMFREPGMRVKLEQLSNGVAQQNLSPVLASKMDFARPPQELRQQFATLAGPMVRRIVQLYSTIQNLRRTRDLLLPRLLSGQVEPKEETT
jgi:type I restriction enzyme S subunit